MPTDDSSKKSGPTPYSIEDHPTHPSGGRKVMKPDSAPGESKETMTSKPGFYTGGSKTEGLLIEDYGNRIKRTYMKKDSSGTYVKDDNQRR